MSHYYRHSRENRYEPAQHASSLKRNPFQTSNSPRMARNLPGNPTYPADMNFSPSKMRAHLKGKQTNHDNDQNLLEMLNSTVACLKQKNMALEALGCLEQSLWLKRRMFWVDNSVVHKALNEVMLSYNSMAMQYLAQGQFDQCLAMLRKAEAITAPGNFKRCQALQILTFNNIGCCYRKLGKLKSALKYLKEAAQIGSGSAHVKNLSITHLNLCAIQSQLGRHDLALEHAQAAIFHTQEELVSLEDGCVRDEDGDGKDQGALDPKTREEKIISLAVAYHNLAVELEFNGRGEASLQWYKKALQLVWKYKESNEALCESFKKIFLDAKKKQQTANIRQNGIPASASTPNIAVNGRRLTRPKSAHASSRSDVEREDVSYSSTVASQCYKPTKPSTAGQRYEPSRSTTTQGGKLRSTSASRRQRPMSAKPSTLVNYRDTSRGSRDLVENAFELHWKRLEKEHALDDVQTCPMKTKRSLRRPQSAGSVSAATQRRNQVPVDTQRQKTLQGQLYFGAHEEDFSGNDEDYGVINDDGSSEDGFDNYSDRSSNQWERHTGGAKVRNERPVNARNAHQGASSGSRHRRALNESRSRASLNPSELFDDSDIIISKGPEESSPSVSLTDYNADDDTDPDLPAQRVCHMEYLRRMKKLAESIKNDLNGVGIRSPTIKPIDVASSYSRKSLHLKEGNGRADSECGSSVSTPRATSKLREQVELARRDNSPEVESQDTGKSNEVQSVIPATTHQNLDEVGIDLDEDVHVFQSEADARDAELDLFRAAAGCRLQAFFRGQRSRTEVKQLRQVKLENASAISIQRKMRQYLKALKEERRLEEERLELEFQKQEVEDMAACLIQRLCRRALGRKNINVNGSQDDEEKKQSPVPVRRAFSIADVALGASVRSVGSTRTQLKQGHSEPVQPSHLNSAATVPHLNLRRVREPETPRRSLTESSISLSNPDRTANSTKRSDIYDDEEEWKAPPPHSAHPTPRTNRSSKDNGTTSSVRSVTSTPRTNRTEDQPKTPQNDLVAGTPRNTTEEHTRRQNAAATRIQASSRGFAVRQRTRRQNAAATRIQASIRGFVVRQCTRRQNAAATRVQASIKGFVVRQRFAVENAVDLCRAYIERKHFDVTLDHAMTLELDFLEELSAIKIQALVRGCQSRLLTECTKAGVYHAVNTIQRSFRLHRLNTQRSIDEGVRSIAARTIQQVFRDYEVRRAAVHQAAVDEEILRVQQIAASTIQNIWKQYHLAQDLNFEEIEAATCIQALGRGHLTRKSLKSLHGSSSGALSKHSSAFSMSSSTEKLVKEEESDVEVSLHINYSFLPSRIRELYISSSGKQLQSRNTHIQSQEISELGLTFADFLRELETCTEAVVGSSALDAMRIVVETSPDATKTLANVVKLAQVLDRRLQEGFWNEIIETSSMALLHAFKDVLDSQ